jgi:hypothetical protein
MLPTDSGPDTGWVDMGGGVLRNATGGDVLELGSYFRFASAEDYAPPFIWRGKIRPISLMDPPVFRNGTPAHYRPGLVFHAMYGSSWTRAAGNDENVLIGLGTHDRPAGHVGISAELRAERPATPYGARSGYARKHVRGVAPSPFFDGAWHDFVVTVHSHAHYTLEWDGVIMADVEENLPATMTGRNHVGLRADFLGIEIRDFSVTSIDEPAEAFDNDQQPNYSSGPAPTLDGAMPFDFSRFDWYPDGLGGAAQVSRSDGRPRPALRTPLDTFAVHYGGAGTQWLDSGDTIQELRGVELNWARPNLTPNEYNSASDIDAQTWEYAGPFRAAHSGGNNDTVWGHLCLYGLEAITEDQAQALIAGIRRARAQAVHAGYVTADHEVKGHQELNGASTGCPGPLFTNKRWWAQITRPVLTDAPIKAVSQPTEEDLDMPALFVIDTELKGTFALVSGRWVPWLGTLTAGVEVVEADHPWTRAQIFHDQGPDGTDLWCLRSGKTLAELLTIE